MKLRIVTVAALVACFAAANAQAQIKNRLDPEDYDYVLGEGVKTKEITFYSEGVACWGKIFFPADFTETGKWPAVVLGHGWTGTHASLEQYGNRFAVRGLVAMAIDYRGWGNSNGFITLAEPVKSDDQKRRTQATADVLVKRTRLLPMKQVEDYRNAISFIQGEPGVDRDRIGIWGSSFSGGHIVTVSALDSRVKAAVGQVPAVSGKNIPRTPRKWPASIQEEAVSRARTGKGGAVASWPRMLRIFGWQQSLELFPAEARDPAVADASYRRAHEAARGDLLQRRGVREDVARDERHATLLEVALHLVAARAVRLRVHDDLRRPVAHSTPPSPVQYHTR